MFFHARSDPQADTLNYGGLGNNVLQYSCHNNTLVTRNNVIIMGQEPLEVHMYAVLDWN